MSYPMRFCKRCKGTPEINGDEKEKYWVACFDCNYTIPIKYNTAIESVSCWNRIQLLVRDG